MSCVGGSRRLVSLQGILYIHLFSKSPSFYMYTNILTLKLYLWDFLKSKPKPVTVDKKESTRKQTNQNQKPNKNKNSLSL